ncbi:MAG: ABC transporter permease subunit [Candidatus Bathyarchaeia archaeon]
MTNGFVGSIMATLDKLSSRPAVKRVVYAGTILFLVSFILLPPVLGITFKLGLAEQVFQNPELLVRAEAAILWSFTIALSVAAFDLLAGLPLAWIIARGRSRWISVVDALADIPFIIPTVALGFSTLLFWGNTGPIGFLGFSIPPGLALVLLLHFAFSFPVIVRVMVGELLAYTSIYETAAKTLGARSFTIARTVTLPMLRPGLIAAFLLAFARSLSETGATVIVAGAFENGPVFIANAKNAGLEGPMVLVSFALIISSVAVFALIRLLGNRLKIPLNRVFPGAESRLSSKGSVGMRNAVTFLIFGMFVLIPSIYITFPAFGALTDGTLQKALSGTGVWSSFWQSMALSYVIGVMATLINIAAGLPVAILIARKRLGRVATTVLDAAVNVPIVVPSVALGVSLGFFWRSFGFLPEFWILVFAHTTITYTYFVKAMAAAIEGIPEEMEETARTLGSRPLHVFRKIILPLTKYSFLSGAILVFTRSVDETGAATAVSQTLKTAPVLLVSWVKHQIPVTDSEIALGIAFLVLTSFAALLVLRLIVYRRK